MTARPTIRIAPSTPVDGRLPTASTPPKASLGNLLLAPHRLAFFAGGVMLLLASLAWLLLLALPLAGVSITTALPPTLVHGFVFSAAYMPLYIAGFMFTAGPRWLDVPAPAASALVWPVRLHVAGIVLLLVGTVVSPGTAAFGSLLLAIAWTAIGVAFATLVRTSPARDRLHARCVLVFWIAGIAAALLFASGLATHQFSVVAAAVWLVVFACVAPITVTVAHRVLPFFTSSAVTTMVPWRPNWVLGLLVAGIVMFGALQIAGRLDLADARSVAWLTLATVAPTSFALIALAVRWGLVQSLRGPSLRLVAMLHVAFVWIPIALALAAFDAALVLLETNAPRLGLMPLHALTMGFLGSMLFAMATRVISGHGGLAVTADRFVWRLFWALQATTLLRLAAPLSTATTVALPAAAATLWTFVWTVWAVRYLPILLRARADGRPG